MNFHQAFSLGVAGRITRPFDEILESQAASCLSPEGGFGSSRVENYNFKGLLSFQSAHSEVAGSYDACHDRYTTCASSAIEKLDVAGVLTADRVVARMVAYSPVVGDKEGQNSFDITGSHFENLRIAGTAIDAKLATHRFHEYDSFSKLEKAFDDNTADDLLPWAGLSDKQLEELERREGGFCTLPRMSIRAKEWRSRKVRTKRDSYWCSAASHLDLRDPDKETGLSTFGALILVPRFGGISIGEVLSSKSTRQLVMLRLFLGSPTAGTIVAGSVMTGGSGFEGPAAIKGRNGGGGIGG